MSHILSATLRQQQNTQWNAQQQINTPTVHFPKFCILHKVPKDPRAFKFMHACSLERTRTHMHARRAVSIDWYINTLAGPLYHFDTQRPFTSSQRRQVYKTSQDTRKPCCRAEHRSEPQHTEPIRRVLHHCRCCYWSMNFYHLSNAAADHCGGWRCMCRVSFPREEARFSNISHHVRCCKTWSAWCKRLDAAWEKEGSETERIICNGKLKTELSTKITSMFLRKKPPNLLVEPLENDLTGLS